MVGASRQARIDQLQFPPNLLWYLRACRTLRVSRLLLPPRWRPFSRLDPSLHRVLPNLHRQLEEKVVGGMNIWLAPTCARAPGSHGLLQSVSGCEASTQPTG